MTNTISTASLDSGLERVRARLLSELHAGKLRPGDRVPSVRRLADLTGMNRKTIHRAYTSLVHEGLLEARPGSGTYISESTGQQAEAFQVDELLQTLGRSRDEAASLGVDPATFVGFLAAGLADGLRGVPVTIADCSDETASALGRTLAERLDVEPRRLRIQDLDRDPQLAIRGTRVVVTTPAHVVRLTKIFSPLGISVFSVNFDGEFPRTVARVAAERPVLLIVADSGFQSTFLKDLESVGATAETMRNLRIVTAADAPQALNASPNAQVYLSPQCADKVDVPTRFKRLNTGWRLKASSVENLRAMLAMDLALRQAASRRLS